MADQKSLPVVPAQRNAPAVETPDKLDGVPADYTRKVDTSRHLEEHVHGKRTSFSQETKTDDASKGVFDNRVIEVVDGALRQRKAAEDKRANHRNFNRLMTLLGAVIIGLVLTWLSVRGFIPKSVSPYTFVITVLLDSAFSFYALLRHY
jgi:hypothetical protein